MTAPERADRRWDVARLLLAGVWLLLLLSALLLREDRQTLRELYDEVAAGQVERVALVGGLSAHDRERPEAVGPGGGGSAQLDVRWGRLGDRSTVRLVEVTGQEQSSGHDGREVTFDDVEERLRGLDPDLVVDRRPYDGSTGHLLGARLPGPAVALLLAAFLATLYLLVNGPQPWRATRWAWFWLLASPFGALALCLLSGRTPGLPRPASARRLTGGWAFLLGSLLGGGSWAG